MCLLPDKHVVVGIGGQGESIGVIGARGLDGADQGLVPEELPDVWDRAAGQGTVLELGRVLVKDDMLRRWENSG